MGNHRYWATALARKLGFMPGFRVLLRNLLAGCADWVAQLPEGMVFVEGVTPAADIVHLFALRKAELADELVALRHGLRTGAAIWVSSPKNACEWPTDITEDTVRELALLLGLVDTKVCAVTEVWPGLKLVLRKELR